MGQFCVLPRCVRRGAAAASPGGCSRAGGGAEGERRDGEAKAEGRRRGWG